MRALPLRNILRHDIRDAGGDEYNYWLGDHFDRWLFRLIPDVSIPSPCKRREMAIGHERTKAFISWYKVNKQQF